MAKKVGTAKKAEAKNEKPEVKRTAYTGGERDADHRLVSIPADFDPKKHEPLGKDDFANMGVYLMFRSEQLTTRANHMLEVAADLKVRADRLVKYKDEATRKSVEKLARMRKTLLELQNNLVGQGVDLSDIDLDLSDLGEGDEAVEGEVAQA